MASDSQGMVTAVFRNHVNAENAYLWLRDHGYDPSELNVLMSENHAEGGDGAAISTAAGLKETDPLKNSSEKNGTPRRQTPGGMALGGAIGTAVGASLAALLAVSATVAIPGLGLLAAGPVLAALAGGGAGALTGGAIGALVGLGLSEPDARIYERALQEGGVILGVSPHTDEDRQRIRICFEKIGGENVSSY